MLTNMYKLPVPYAKACGKGEEPYKYTEHRYSITSLNNGVMYNVLSRQHEIEEDVADMAWRVFGTAIHDYLSKFAEEGQAEQKLEYTHKFSRNNRDYEVTISGIFDLLEDGYLIDYKTASINKLRFDDWADYENQLIGYSWLYWKAKGIKIDNGELFCFLKDWSKPESMRDSSLPPFPIHVHKITITDFDREAWQCMMEDKLAQVEDSLFYGAEPIECNPLERFEKPSKFAVYKDKTSAKAMKLFDSKEEAEEYSLKGKYCGNWIQERPSTSTKCEAYCPYKQYCSFYASYENRESIWHEKEHKDGDKVK